MTKPSDLFKKTGTGGASGAKVNPFAQIPGLGVPASEQDAKEKFERSGHHPESTHGSRIDKGKDPGKGAGKTLGGAGGAGGRPKV